MQLTWKDGLATVFVGTAVVLYGLWLEGSTIAGIPGTRTLVVVLFALGVGGCYSARSQFEVVYGAGGLRRPPLFYVVLVSVLGGVTVGAGVLAFVTSSTGALATMVATMAALWVLATVRHASSRTPARVARAAR